MSKRFTIIDDFSNPRIKSRAIAAIGALQGVQRIDVCEYRPRRSDRQLKYYFPCFCEPFGQRLIEEGNEFSDPKDAAHEIFKAMFLRTAVVLRQGNQRLPFVRSTGELNTAEFNLYLDNCARFLAELNITVPEPNIYHEKE